MSRDENNADSTSRAAYIWNTIAGILNAFQSVIILMVIARFCDVATAGVFTFAYANGNLFLNVGKYGMRPFQASDRTEQFSFREYRASRFVTVAAMLITGFAYLVYLAASNSYSTEKTATIALFCVYEAIAAIEDIYHGNYQQHDRLDVGARLLTFRIGSTIVVMCVFVAVTKSLLMAIAIATTYTIVFLCGELLFAKRHYKLPIIGRATFSLGTIGQLLKTCFPLFAAAFLLFYIGNAPRYAIDSFLTDADQAYYGYIAMPVFIVTLLASFIYNPMITSLTDQWNQGALRSFASRFLKLGFVIVGLTAACDFAALIAGVPVLDFLYRADTAPYLSNLIVLVSGGGFLALSSLAVLGITIIRFQNILIPVYALAAIFAWALTNYAVPQFGIDGAAWSYFICMFILAGVLITLFAFRLNKSADRLRE